MHRAPLADEIRPRRLDDIVGQEHLFGPNGALTRMLASGRLANMIFHGPPGTGKTTAASVIAEGAGMEFRRLNATTAALGDIRRALSETETVFGAEGILLYLDEIQYLNRRQQQSLLEYLEDGRVTLIASTTENPHFCLYDSLLSRVSLFEFRPVRPDACLTVLRKALARLNEEAGTDAVLPEETGRLIAEGAAGDVRRAVGILEVAYYAAGLGPRAEITPDCLSAVGMGVGRVNSDVRYDLLSCLQKSIRGSDPDAASFYVAKMLAAGDMLPLCRRLQVIASEDVGLAYPQAAAVVRACCESARELGMPEAQIPLIHAALLLATAPKSNSAYAALTAAAADVEAGRGQVVPVCLRSPLFKGYRYPHDYPLHYVEQEYLPEDLRGRRYYVPGPSKTEQAAAAFWDAVRAKAKNGGTEGP